MSGESEVQEESQPEPEATQPRATEATQPRPESVREKLAVLLETYERTFESFVRIAKKARELEPGVAKEAIHAAREIILTSYQQSPQATATQSEAKPPDIKIPPPNITVHIPRSVEEGVEEAKKTARRALETVESHSERVERVEGRVEKVELALERLASALQTQSELLRELVEVQKRFNESEARSKPYKGRVVEEQLPDGRVVRYELLPEDEANLRFARFVTDDAGKTVVSELRELRRDLTRIGERLMDMFETDIKRALRARLKPPPQLVPEATVEEAVEAVRRLREVAEKSEEQEGEEGSGAEGSPGSLGQGGSG